LCDSLFSTRIPLFSVYIRCFTATAKIIRVDILINANSILKNGGYNSLSIFYELFLFLGKYDELRINTYIRFRYDIS
jgi:hypothetical protein